MKKNVFMIQVNYDDFYEDFAEFPGANETQALCRAASSWMDTSFDEGYDVDLMSLKIDVNDEHVVLLTIEHRDLGSVRGEEVLFRVKPSDTPKSILDIEA